MSTPLVVPATGNGSGVRGDAMPGSLLADLRQRAAAQRAERHVELEIGGDFGDMLIARYGVLDVHELERYATLQGNTGNVELSLEMLAATCKCLLARDGETLVELRDEQGSVTYGPRLARLLGMPGADERDIPPRETILALFGQNAMQLGAHVTRLVEWMTDPSADASGKLSVATP
jgi:hypothetical protein